MYVQVSEYTFNTIRKHISILLRKLEQKFDKFAIPKLYLVIIVCIIIGYILFYMFPNIYIYLILSPYDVVVNHQYWRLFTWIFSIPYLLNGSLLNVLFLPINLLFYYFLARSLENYWGKFMFNLYVLGEAILIDILVIIGAYFYYFWSPEAQMNRAMYAKLGAYNVTRYMLMSIFLAFTVVGGENMVYLYFVIPLKMKWLAYIDLVLLGIEFVTGHIFDRMIIISVVAAYGTFYLINRGKTHGTLKDKRRKNQFVKAKQKGYKKKAKQARTNPDGTIEFPTSGSKIITPGTGNPEGITIHKCAVCGITEKQNPEMQFRFCSKCNGNYEYCSEHLYTHTHVQ